MNEKIHEKKGKISKKIKIDDNTELQILNTPTKKDRKRPKIITRRTNSNNKLTMCSPNTSDNELDKLEMGLNSLENLEKAIQFHQFSESIKDEDDSCDSESIEKIDTKINREISELSAKDRVIDATGNFSKEIAQETSEKNVSDNESNSPSHHTNNSSEIQINLVGLPQRKINQLKRLKKLIKISHAYSIFYFNRSRWWKWMNWVSSITAVVLASSTIIVNTFFDPCSNQQTVRNYNVLLGSLITIFLGIKSVLNARLRQRDYEEAGDEYKILAQEIYREVFFCNLSYEELDLALLIDKYSIKFDAYTKNFKEPSPSKIDEIMNSKDYGLAVKFIL